MLNISEGIPNNKQTYYRIANCITTDEQVSCETIIKEFSSNTFTNYIYRTVIPDSYMKRYNCIECGEPAKNRCHGIGEERPLLLERALNKIRANNVEKIKMIDLKIAFIEEHKNTSFDFKCVECHKNEKIIII